jgi:uncharacterized protein (TIGR02145 family)
VSFCKEILLIRPPAREKSIYLSVNDLTKNNRSGFSALPGGCRYYNGYFDNIGRFGYWWSATEYIAPESIAPNAFIRFLFSDNDCISWDFSSKSCGFSVRLVKD